MIFLMYGKWKIAWVLGEMGLNEWKMGKKRGEEEEMRGVRNGRTSWFFCFFVCLKDVNYPLRLNCLS